MLENLFEQYDLMQYAPYLVAAAAFFIGVYILKKVLRMAFTITVTAILAFVLLTVISDNPVDQIQDWIDSGRDHVATVEEKANRIMTVIDVIQDNKPATHLKNAIKELPAAKDIPGLDVKKVKQVTDDIDETFREIEKLYVDPGR